MDSVCAKLEMKFESGITPGSCTSTKAGGVYANKPFKERMTKTNDKWIATSKLEFIDGGNMKPVPRRTVVQWIIDVRKEVKHEKVAESFKRCNNQMG